MAESLVPISKNAQIVLEKRYLDKDDKGSLVEDADGAYWRVADRLSSELAQYYATPDEISATTVQYYRLMRGGFFLPNSPTIANAGTRTGQLSACFVLPISDSLSNGKDGIYDTLRKAQLIFQTGGGCGYYFGNLRGPTEMVLTTRGFSSGPLSFMDVYDTACQSIAQGGIRRGAQMAILRCDSPQIMEFIRYKEDPTKLTNFNVSVAATDEFLAKLQPGVPDAYEIVDPKAGKKGIFLHARAVFKEIIHRAWSSGEPGLVFIDRMERYNPTPRMGGYQATNPCGEQPLNPWESCNLGSMTLCAFTVRVNHTPGMPVKYKFDFGLLEEMVGTAIELMDNVVDANEYVPARGENPGVPEIREVTLQTRKLGLGVMGLARMLFKLQLPYNSIEGRAFAERVYATIDVTAKEKSNALAKKYGAYPYMKMWWDESVVFHVRVLQERARHARVAGMEDIAVRYENLIPKVTEFGYRNSTVTTVAPTGTLSILHDTSGGCEPQFALVIKRKQADTIMYETDKVFVQEMRDRGFTDELIELVIQTVADHRGSLVESISSGVLCDLLSKNEEIYEALIEMSKVYIVAGDIAPTDHVLMQAGLQKYCCSAISKTINFPKEATEEDVAVAYRLAIDSGCKGITVYRDGCRDHQPLTAGSGETKPEIVETVQVVESRVPEKLPPRYRPDRLYGLTERRETGDGRVYVNVGYDGEGPREVFIEVGRAGGVLNGFSEALGRMISVALKYRVPLDEIATMLVGIRSANQHGFGKNTIFSIPDAVGQILRLIPKSIFASVVGDGEPEPVPAEAVVVPELEPAGIQVDNRRQNTEHYGESPECRECGSPMKFDNGCRGGTCTNEACGFAKC
jgi:ribonucleoside-diphosphate reductase alpha chain